MENKNIEELQYDATTAVAVLYGMSVQVKDTDISCEQSSFLCRTEKGIINSWVSQNLAVFYIDEFAVYLLMSWLILTGMKNSR